MDDGTPSLEVGFAIDTEGSFDNLMRLQEVMSSTEAKVVKEAQSIERATSGMLNLAGATASVTAFATATDRSTQQAARSLAQVERSGESMVRSLERQASTFGKTSSEIRQMKAETAALAAEQQGLTDLAERIRAAEAAIYDQEFAAMRKAAQAAEDAAQDKAAAAARATAAAENEAQAVRSAALAYQMFEAAARDGMAALRQQQAAAEAATAETDRLSAAAARLRGSLDPVVAAQQRFDAEMAQTRTLISAGVISLDEYVAKLRLEQAALDAVNSGHAGGVKGANAMRFAMTGLSYQVQDTFTQLSMGANALQVIAIQGGQAAGQFAMVEGKAGSLARFMIGPWGLAFTAAALVMGPLLSKLLGTNDALGEAIEKLKKDAEQAEIARKAKDTFGKTVAGVTAALQDQAEALKKSDEATRTAAENANIQAKAERDRALAIRDGTAAMLERQRQQAQDQVDALRMQSQGGGQRGELGALGLDQALRHLTAVEAAITQNRTNALEAEKQYQATRVDLAIETAKKLSTPEGRINQMYDDQVAAARTRALEIAKSGGTVTTALTAEIGRIETARQAALKAEQDRQAAIKATNNEIGRNIDLNEARKIAESVGGRVTSGQRSTAEQAKLYAKYKAGTGNLAAAPGSSYHEIGQALDVAKAEGVTLKKLVDAYKKAGVKVVEALDEGDHFHIAWAKVGDAAKIQNEAEEQAKRQTEHIALLKVQTDGLYALADSYKLSGAAALIAEAQEKAHAEAVKNGGDLAAETDRQIRLAVAQRVADASKSTAAMNEQAKAQEQVNAMVAAGLIPADRASQVLSDQLALQPLLAAQEAARISNDKVGYAAVTKLIGEMAAAQKRDNDAKREAQLLSAMANGDDEIARLKLELQLVGQTDAARTRALAVLKATQDAAKMTDDPAARAKYVAQQMTIFGLSKSITDQTRDWNDQLSFAADKWSLIAQNMQEASTGLADAFGAGGQALGDITLRFAQYAEMRAKADQAHKDTTAAINASQLSGDAKAAALARENTKYALQSGTAQIDMFGDMAQAAKGFFAEGTAGYKAMADAEKVFRAIQFALSVKAMAQDAIETASSIANSVLRAAKFAIEAVAKAIASLPFPANLVAGAATAAALAAIGISIVGAFGGKNDLPKANDGTGTVLGDATAKSDSIKNSLDSLKSIDTLTNVYSRQMLESLRSIDTQISGFTAQILQAGNINASAGVKTGFQTNALGHFLSGDYNPVIKLVEQIPVVGSIVNAIGGLIKSLFGTSTKVTGTGLYGSSQSLGSILNGGFNAQYYSDIEKTKKFLGITTGHSYSTQYSAADPALANQFTLILKSFNDAIAAAAGPLGQSTAAIQQRLNSFVVNIGKIDLTGLTGDQIQEKLTAVFGAAADQMATVAFPDILQFQKAGEGAFETLVRVSSTVEAVTTALDELGTSTQNVGIAAKMGLADQFDSLSDFSSAVDGYFQAFYSQEEQAAAKTAQFSKVFASLGLAMPDTLAGFRALVEAQDLTTAAGQQTYATLLQLAPAFADLQNALNGAKSAADIASERADLQRQLLELQGNTAAIRALDLAKLDPSNRALQQQIYDLQDAQDAAKAAQDLADAWKSVGDSIMDEVKRIRGLTDSGSGGFASLLGQFNAATAAARAGDQDAAKSLPGLSQSLLTAAANVATSQQELRRIQAQTAASLEATYNAIAAMTGASTTSSPATAPIDALLAAVTATQAATTPSAANDDLADEVRQLREEVVGMRADNNAGHAANASANNKTVKILDTVTQASGGDAIATRAAA